MQKTLLNRPSKYKPPPRGAFTWKIALKYKVKQSQNGNLLPTSPIDFETEIFLRR